jgi:hypothetical protein
MTGTGAKLRTALVALLAIAIVVVATRVSRRLFETPRPTPVTEPQIALAAPPTAAALGQDPHVFEVVTAAGKVEVQRGEAWTPIRQGDKLTLSDVVRTSAASGAVLRLAAGTEIELRAGVEIRLDAWSAGGPAPAGSDSPPGPGSGAPPLAGGTTVDLRGGNVVGRLGAGGARG